MKRFIYFSALALIIAFFLRFPMFAQTPTISGISIPTYGITHDSALIIYNVSGSDQCMVQWGTSSGAYPWQTESAPTYSGSPGYSNGCQVSISGLAPNTTYYVLPTARPGLNSTSNNCNTIGCGAVETTFTTLTLPSPHPALPTPPTTWMPVEPVTSGYTIVSMVNTGAGGTWVAASNVAQQTNWTAAITAGASLQTVYNSVWCNTVIEFPEGTPGVVPQSGSRNQGIDWTQNIFSGCGSNYLVFRTHQNAAGDFPPFGMRTGPQFASKLAKFTSNTPAMPYVGCNAPYIQNCQQNFNGQLFDCYQAACNHIWVENLEFDHAFNTTIYPTGAVDPPVFGPYVRMQPVQYASTLPSGTTPDHIVLDRIYAPGNAYPSREEGCFVPGGTYWAIINSYCVTNFATVGVVPVSTPTASGSTITVPASNFQLNAFDATPIGTTTTATITCSGANCGTYTGAFMAWLGTGGLTFEYQTATGVSFSCSAGPCTTVGVTTPAAADIPSTYSMFFFSGVYDGAGNADIYEAVYGNLINQGNPSIYYQFRPLGLNLQLSQYGVYDNNYMQALGQTMYTDPQGIFADMSWTHNYLYFPRSQMQNSGTWDGYGYTYRNIIEAKQEVRGSYNGNIIDGAASFRNPGNAFYMASSAYGSYSLGVQDIAFTNNVIKHVSAGFQCAGSSTSPGGSPNAPIGIRIQASNNFWLDINRTLYGSTGSGGLVSNWASTYPECSDVSLFNNTVGLTLGTGPGFFIFGGNSGFGTGLGDGLSIHHNLSLGSIAQSIDFISSIDGGQQGPSNFPISPYAVASVSPPASPGQWQTYLNGDWIHYDNVTNPASWAMNNNIIVGAQNNRSGTGYVDLSPSDINTYIQAQWPSGDSSTNFPCSSGDPLNAACVSSGTTFANRLLSIGWNSANLTNGNPYYYPPAATVWNPGTVGADVTIVNQATGTVNNIILSTASTVLQITYTAPDSRACYTDISTDGITWGTRTSDGGGEFARSVQFTGLTAATLYYYRLMCYFDQSATYEFLASQITSGTISTAASATRTVYTTFTLPATATKAVISFQGLTGSPISGTYTTSPASTASVPVGVAARTITFETSGSVVVGTPGTVNVTVN